MADSANNPHTRNNAAGSDQERAALRLLLIAPASPPHLSGGMDVAVASVAAELRRRGWLVDMPLVAAPESSTAAGVDLALHLPSGIRSPSLLGLLLRSPLRSLFRLPQLLRGYPGLLVTRATAGKFNDNLSAMERVASASPRPDAVLLF